jgi:hypothetical protein
MLEACDVLPSLISTQPSADWNSKMVPVVSLLADNKFVFGSGAVAALMLLYCSKFKAPATLQFLRRRNKSAASENQVVLVTGCDSGLGFSIALHAHKLGFTVVAGCLQAGGQGGTRLQELCPDRLHVLALDVTSGVSVLAAVDTVQDILARNPHYGRPTYFTQWYDQWRLVSI